MFSKIKTADVDAAMEELFNLADDGKLKDMTYICVSTALMHLRQGLVEKITVHVEKKRGELLGICLSFPEPVVGSSMKFKIEEVKSDSPAEKSGLKLNDVVVKINERRFTTLRKAFVYISKQKKLRLTIERKV
tara:strand:+ start:107 stop:505 length:399 start_codon:yes stop_codon:yes gene_type:complete